MTAPVVTPPAEDLYEELGVTQPLDETSGWPFLILMAGIASALGRLPTIVRDTDDGPGWSAVLDVDRCPDWALPWLAQFVGVRVQPGEDPATSRGRIVAHAGFNRGTPGAMRAAIALTLTGTDPHITIVEHPDGDPWALQVFTLTSQTPDPVATLAAALSQKPAGMVLTHDVVDGTTWNEATSTWDAAAPTWDAASDGPI